MTTATYTVNDIAFTTIDAAEEAMRVTEGWADIVTTDTFAVNSDTDAVACFPSEEAMDADPDAAHAPRIVITYNA